jgi:hypothetical protein
MAGHSVLQKELSLTPNGRPFSLTGPYPVPNGRHDRGGRRGRSRGGESPSLTRMGGRRGGGFYGRRAGEARLRPVGSTGGEIEGVWAQRKCRKALFLGYVAGYLTFRAYAEAINGRVYSTGDMWLAI